MSPNCTTPNSKQNGTGNTKNTLPKIASIVHQEGVGSGSNLPTYALIQAMQLHMAANMVFAKSVKRKSAAFATTNGIPHAIVPRTNRPRNSSSWPRKRAGNSATTVKPPSSSEKAATT